MTAKKATTARKSSKASKTASKKASATASASAKHTAHLAHVAHVAHLAHLAATGKSVTVKAKAAVPAKATKAVAFGIGDWLPVCGIEALAQSLRLAGQPVHGDEVAELWHLLGEPAEGVPVGEALAAAALFGLAGCRPAWDVAAPGAEGLESWRADELFHVGVDRPGVELAAAFGAGAVGVVKLPVLDGPVVAERVARGHGLILRIDVPGPHAVLATADGWWSWGELYSPWPCRVEAAWAVSWS